MSKIKKQSRFLPSISLTIRAGQTYNLTWVWLNFLNLD